jgi:hypothetical protein
MIFPKSYKFKKLDVNMQLSQNAMSFVFRKALSRVMIITDGNVINVWNKDEPIFNESAAIGSLRIPKKWESYES